MKTASGYYKTSYSANLSSYLKTLQNDSRLTEQSADKLALQAAERAKLEEKLAG
jgi:hypothetical protein